MKGALTLLLLLIGAVVYAQIDTVSAQLAGLKDLYANKKITLNQYEEMSKRLLRGNATPGQQPEQPVKQAEVSPAILDTTSYARTEEYCMLIGTFKPFSTKVTVEVDFGQKVSPSGSFNNKSGRLAEFESMADALNFMNGKGWELYAAYPMNGYLGVAYHYLLKRKIVHK